MASRAYPAAGHPLREHCCGTGPAPRGTRRDLRALTLLANIVMAWMTQHIQRVLDAWQHAGTRRVEGDQLRHIAPVHMQGINLRGVLQFPVARYRNRLILETPSRARQRANATTEEAHPSQEALDSTRESDSTER